MSTTTTTMHEYDEGHARVAPGDAYDVAWTCKWIIEVCCSWQFGQWCYARPDFVERGIGHAGEVFDTRGEAQRVADALNRR